MDSTLKGALIGAGATLVAVIIAGLVNYLATQRQENKRLKTQKKEDLYIAIIDIERAMYLYFVCISSLYNKLEYNIEYIDKARDKAFAKIELLTTVYFQELEIERAMDTISNFEKSYVYYLRPGYTREFSASDIVSANTLYRKVEKETTALKVAVFKL